MNAKFSPVEYLLRNAETPKKSSQLGISNLSFYVSTWFSTMFLKKTEFFAHFRALVFDFLFSCLFTFFFSFFPAVIGGAVVGLLCAILCVMFVVYRMRKKDEGSYCK